MIRLLKTPFISMLLGGSLFLLTTFFLLQRPLLASAHSAHTDEVITPTEFWERHDSEMDQLVQEVQREKTALAKREAELKELATRLQAERAEINTVTQRMAQLQAEFDQNVVRLKEEEIP